MCPKTLCIDRGDRDGALRWLAEGKKILAAAPATPELQCEAAAFAQVELLLADGEVQKFSKHAKFQAHSRRHSRPYS